MESKEAKSILLSPRTIILYIIALIIFIPMHAYNLYVVYRFWYGYPFLVSIISSLLVLLLGKVVMVKPQEIVVIYAASAFSAALTLYFGFMPYSLVYYPMLPLGGEAYQKIADIVPTWLKEPVPIEILRQMYPGGAGFPISIWFPTILMGFLMIVPPMIFTTAWATLISKRWIREEKLPFPNAIPACVFLQTYSKMVSPKRSLLYSKESTMIWIGFLFGVALHGMYFFLVYSEWAAGGAVLPIRPANINFPTDFSWLAPYLPGAQLNWAEGGWGLWMWLPVSLLIPLDVLATSLIWYFWWFWFFPAIGNTIGLFPVRATAGEIATGSESYFIYGSEHAYFGVFLAMFVMTIYGARGYIASSIRNAYRRIKPEDPTDVPDFWIWSLIVATTLFIIAFWTILGANPLSILISLIIAVVIGIGGSRAVAESHWGVWARGVLDQFSAGAGSLYGWTNPYFSTSVAMSRSATIFINQAFFSSREWGHGMPYINEFYKIADETGTSRRDVFLIMIVTSIIATFLGYIMVYHVAYSWGLDTTVSGWRMAGTLKGTGSDLAAFLQGGTVSPLSYYPPLFWQSSAIGFIITLLVYFGRMRYPWLWINPVGFVLGGTSDAWFRAANVVAFVVVFLAVRVGGAEFYRKYLLRFAVGAFIGSYAAEFTARYIGRAGFLVLAKLLGIGQVAYVNLFSGPGLIVPVFFFGLPIAAIIVPRLMERKKQIEKTASQ